MPTTMKKHLNLILLSPLILLLIISCKKEEESFREGWFGSRLQNDKTDLKILEEQATQYKPVEEFKVQFYNEDGNKELEYATFADMPNPLSLTEGSYQIRTHSNDLQDAAFEAPYFTGFKDFSIQEGQETQVQITCQLGNVLISLDYSEALLNSLDLQKVMVSNGKASLTFEPEESRVGYFCELQQRRTRGRYWANGHSFCVWWNQSELYFGQSSRSYFTLFCLQRCRCECPCEYKSRF